MEYTVKYRTSDGQVDFTVVEAASRAAVFVLLEKRGISAIAVTEGVHKNARSSVASPKDPTPMRGILAGLCVAVLAVAAWWYFGGRRATALPTEKVKVEKSDGSRAVATCLPMGKGERTSRPAVIATNALAAKPEAKKGDFGKRLDLVAVTNKSGEIMERWRTPDGKTHARLIPPPPVFDNVIDQTLSIALSVPPGHSLPPMPSLGPDSTKAFAEALKNPIVIRDDDPEDVKKAKLLVQSGREAIFEALKSGKSVQEIIADHCAAVNDNAELHNAVGSEYRKLIAEGDLEAAEEYRVKANEVLEKSGAATVPQHGTKARRSANQKGQEKK